MYLPSHRVAVRVENLHVACRILYMCRMMHFLLESMSLCVVDVVCCCLFPLCAFAITEWWFKFDGKEEGLCVPNFSYPGLWSWVAGAHFWKLLITLTPYKIVEAEFEVCTVHVAFQICTEWCIFVLKSTSALCGRCRVCYVFCAFATTEWWFKLDVFLRGGMCAKCFSPG